MRIVLADDHAILRQGLRSLLDNLSGYEVIGEANNGREAIRLVEELTPELVILDIAMPELDGIKAAGVLKEKFPNLKIIILSIYSDASYIRQAFNHGASGYLLKEAAFDELKMALEFIAQDRTYMSSSLMPVVIDTFVEKTPDESEMEKYQRLTDREKEILKLIIKGYKRAEIANELYISLKTVDQHKKNIKDKLEISDFVELPSHTSFLES